MPSGVTIAEESLTAFTNLCSRRGTNKPKFIIYKITDNRSTVVVEKSSSEQDYEVSLQKLSSAGGPRYAVYDEDFDFGRIGRGTGRFFISWVPGDTPVKLRTIYASTKEHLRGALDVRLSIHADSLDKVEWKTMLNVASGGQMPMRAMVMFNIINQLYTK